MVRHFPIYLVFGMSFLGALYILSFMTTLMGFSYVNCSSGNSTSWFSALVCSFSSFSFKSGFFQSTASIHLLLRLSGRYLFIFLSKYAVWDMYSLFGVLHFL